jgi:hypothetical protein
LDKPKSTSKFSFSRLSVKLSESDVFFSDVSLLAICPRRRTSELPSSQTIALFKKMLICLKSEKINK